MFFVLSDLVVKGGEIGLFIFVKGEIWFLGGR